MARKSRKTSLAQKVVGTAAVGMPEPVKKAVSTRWGSRIALVAAMLLFVSGIVTVQWSDYRPHLKINRERAEEVKEAIVDRASKLGIEKADRSDAPGFFGRRAN